MLWNDLVTAQIDLPSPPGAADHDGGGGGGGRGPRASTVDASALKRAVADAIARQTPTADVELRRTPEHRFFPLDVVQTGDWLANHHLSIARQARQVLATLATVPWRRSAPGIDRALHRSLAAATATATVAVAAAGATTADAADAYDDDDDDHEGARARRFLKSIAFSLGQDVDDGCSQGSAAASSIATLWDFVRYYELLAHYLASTATVVGDAVYCRVRDGSAARVAEFLVDVVFQRGQALADLFRETAAATAAVSGTDDDEDDGSIPAPSVPLTCLWCSEWQRRAVRARARR